MSGDRHPGSARFHELLAEIGALHDKKQADYGSDKDPFANVRASEKWGVQAWAGAMMRLDDKVARLRTFARKGVLANESAEDSMRDIAVYALIALVLYEQQSEDERVAALRAVVEGPTDQTADGESLATREREAALTVPDIAGRDVAAGVYDAETARVHPYTPDMSEHTELLDHMTLEYHEHEGRAMLHEHDADHRIVMDRSA
jgi:hypothetical protein